MTAPRRLAPSRPWLLVGLVALFVASFAAAAYYEWIWWEPYNALLPYLGEAVLLLAAIVLVPAARTRPFAVIPAVVALGLVAGQVLGPSRPELLHGEGTLTVHLTAPVRATGSVEATCATSAEGSDLQVSGDPNLRLDIFPDNPGAPPDLDQREFVGVYLTRGDRWRRSPRADQIDFSISIGRVEAELPETRMMAGPSSKLIIEGGAESGSAEFGDLTLETRLNEQPGEFVDVAGSIEWTCAYGQ